VNQPLHNNAIPAHPEIRAQIAQNQNPVAQAPVPAPTPEPKEIPQEQQNALWDAFDVPREPSPSSVPPAPPPVQVTPPEMPPSPPEVPPSVDDLLSGAGSPAPQVYEPPAPAPVEPPPQQFQAPATPAPVDMGALQKQAIDFLMANEYKLNDEDRTQLISAPDEVLPKLAARMHVGIATQLAQQVAQAIPAMIQQHMETHMKAQRAELEFFGRFPKLNRPEWKPVIAESLQMVRQMNPQATREQIINEGAALAAFRINSKYSQSHVPQPPQQPRAPSQPYVPFAPGGGVTPPTNPNQTANPWADLASDPDFNPW